MSASSVSARALALGLGALAALGTTPALADGIFMTGMQTGLTPASVGTLSAASRTPGGQNGDIVEFVLKATVGSASATAGPGVYFTTYIPSGVEVLGAWFVTDATGATIEAPGQGGRANNGWGARGSKTPFGGPFAGVLNGRQNDEYGDTGIFYSTDPRTQLFTADSSNIAKGPLGNPNATGGTSNGYNVTDTFFKAVDAFNLWDANQVNAFGAGGTLNSVPVNTAPTSSATVINSVGQGVPPLGAGSMVAGPNTGYTKDNTGNVGPWQRVQYPGSQIADVSDGAATAAGTADSPTVLDASALGSSLSDATPLPATTNAVRWAYGYGAVGDVFYVKIRVRLNSSVLSAADGVIMNFESNGSDNQGSGSKDNPWRYFGPTVSQAAAPFVSTQIDRVNGLAYSGGNIPAGATVTYRARYLNVGSVPIGSVTLTNKLTNLVATAGCSAGNPTLTNLSGGVTVTGVSSGTSTCPAAGATVTFGNLPNVAGGRLGGLRGGEFTYDVKLSATATNGATVTDTTTVSATEPVLGAPLTSSDTTTGTIGVVLSADLAIQNTGPAQALLGETLNYRLVVANLGGSSISGATIADLVPGNLSGVTWACTGNGGAQCASGSANASGSGTTLNITTGAMPVNIATWPPTSGAYLSITVTGTAASAGSFTNTATVSAPGGYSDPLPNNGSGVSTTIFSSVPPPAAQTQLTAMCGIVWPGTAPAAGTRSAVITPLVGPQTTLDTSGTQASGYPTYTSANSGVTVSRDRAAGTSPQAASTVTFATPSNAFILHVADIGSGEDQRIMAQDASGALMSPSLIGIDNGAIWNAVTLTLEGAGPSGGAGQGGVYLYYPAPVKTINVTDLGAAGIVTIQLSSFCDYGDAPASYGTTVSGGVGGPVHQMAPVGGILGTDPRDLYLGDTVSGKLNGTPSTNADTDPQDDGVTSFPSLTADDTTYSVSVHAVNNSSTDATLAGWVDFNRDGQFQDTEQSTTTVPASSGAQEYTLTWTGLTGLVSGQSYARFRLFDGSSATATTLSKARGSAPEAGGSMLERASAGRSRTASYQQVSRAVAPAATTSPTGWLPGGEIEDYALVIAAAAVTPLSCSSIYANVYNAKQVYSIQTSTAALTLATTLPVNAYIGVAALPGATPTLYSDTLPTVHLQSSNGTTTTNTTTAKFGATYGGGLGADASGHLFYIASSAGVQYLWQFGTTSSAAVNLGAITPAIPGDTAWANLAPGDMMSDANGRLYYFGVDASASTSTSYRNYLYYVDASRVAHRLGSYTSAAAGVGVAFDPSGAIYTINRSSLYKIDMTNGFSATLIGDSGNTGLIDLASCALPNMNPNLTATKTVKNTTTNQAPALTTNTNDILEYAVTLTNSGNLPSDGTRFMDAIPAGTSYVPGSTQRCDATSTTCASAADVSGAAPFLGGGMLVNTSGQAAGIVVAGTPNAAVVKFRVKVTSTGSPASIVNTGQATFPTVAAGVPTINTVNTNTTTVPVNAPPPTSGEICTDAGGTLGTVNAFDAASGGSFGTGSGVANEQASPLSSSVVGGYTYANFPPNDGSYTVINNLTQSGFNAWHAPVRGSNTGAANDNFMVVNASYDPGVVIQDTINGLTPNQNYVFMFDLGNLCQNCATDAAFGGPIPPKMQGELTVNGTTTVMGDAGLLATQEPSFSWHTQEFIINPGSGTTATFTLRNNNPGGAGNDFAIDNIRLLTCTMPTGAVSGTVYSDVNRDNALTGGEGGLPNVRVTLVDDRDPANPRTVAAIETDANGAYSFLNVPVGSYKVVVDSSDPDLPAASPLGTPNNLPVTVSSGGSTASHDFGFDLPNTPPTTDDVTADPILNTAPATLTKPLAGADPDGTVVKFVIESLPASGTLSLNGTPLAVGAEVLLAEAGNLTFTPASGSSGNATFTYAAVDNAGAKDATPATYTIPVQSLSISGRVWDDGDGSANNTFSGIPTGLEAGTNAGALFAVLVDSAGNAIQSVPVNADGTYTFNNLSPNTDVLIRLSSVAGTAGQPAPATSLPTGWVSTSPLETPVFNTGNASLTGRDFGIEHLPVVTGGTVSSLPNPTGSSRATVPASIFGGTDPDGTITQYTITSFPTNADSLTINGTTYTPGSFPVGGVSLSANPDGSFPTGAVAVDPTDGTVTVGIPFTATDNAGRTGASSTASLAFAALSISGTVWDDANGDAVQTGESGTNAGGLFAVLTDGAGVVLEVVPVATDGTYSFAQVAPNADVKMLLATVNPALGSTVTSLVLPSGWAGTTPNVLSFNTGSSSVAGQNFGLDQLPDTDNKTIPNQLNPSGANLFTVPTLTGTDPEDGALGSSHAFRIVTLPTGGTLTYNGNPVNAGDTITNYDPTRLKLDPDDATTSLSFTVAAVDAAGQVDPIPATVTMAFTPVVPPVATDNAAQVLPNLLPADANFVLIDVAGNDHADPHSSLDPLSIDLDPSTPGQDLTKTTPEGTFTLVTAGPDAGKVRFTPALSVSLTTATIPYTIKDRFGQASNPANIAVEINVPAANPDSGIAAFDTPVTLDAAANDETIPGRTITPPSIDLDPSAPGQDTTLTVAGKGRFDLLPDGTVKFTPVAGFFGTVTVPYTIQDSSGATSSPSSIIVIVNPPAPDAQDDSSSTSVNTPTVIDLLTNDVGPGINPTSVSVPSSGAGAPAHGGVTIAPDGTITYTPNPGFSGLDAFNYTVCNTAMPTPACDTASTTVNVTPKALSDASSTGAGVAVIIPVSSNDLGSLDPASIDLDPSTPALENTRTIPGQGTFKANPDGSVTFTPASGFSGPVTSLPYTIADTSGQRTSSASISVTVTPVAKPDAVVLGQNTPITIAVLANDAGNLDPASVSVPTSGPSAPQHGTVIVNPDGTLLYTPDPAYSGPDAFKYTVCDRVSPTPQCVTTDVTITVTPNQPPVAQDRTEAKVSSTTTLKLSPLEATDVDGTVVSYTVLTLPSPSQGTLYLGDPANGGTPVRLNQVLTPLEAATLYFKPVPTFSGSATFTFTATDNQGGLDATPATVTIPVNAAPVAKPDSATTPLDTPVTIPVLGNDTDTDGTLVASSIDLDPSTPALDSSLTVPGQGTFAVQPDGSVSFTPAPGFVGAVTVPYTVQDNEGAVSNAAEITVTVVAGTLQGHAFTDLNGNGLQDVGEPNLTNTAVTVTPEGKPSFVLITDANGDYRTLVPPGRVTANVTDPANSRLTTANDPQTLTVADGQTASATPVGFQPLEGTVTGRIFEDKNGNGKYDDGEGLPSVSVKITDALGHVFTVTTDASGTYGQMGVSVGDAVVDINNSSLPAASANENGWVQTVGTDPSTVTVQPSTTNDAGDDGYVRPRITVAKEALAQTAVVGGSVGWRITVTNAGFSDLNEITITDTLPKGLAYKQGSSVLVGGAKIKDPTIDPKNPRLLTWTLSGSLLTPGQKLSITFATTVTPQVQPGKLENTAGASAMSGTSTTPVTATAANAVAAVKIELGVFTDKTVIVGRVYFDVNDNNSFEDGVDKPLEGARVYLSDGRFAVTDAQGRYSLPDVNPGLHALRLDPLTVPYQAKPVPDDQGQRGSRYARATEFGGIQTEDFPLEEPNGALTKNRSTTVERGPVKLEKTVQQGGAGYAIQTVISVGSTVANLTITDPLPNDAQTRRGPLALVSSDGRLIPVELSADGTTIRVPGTLEAGTYTLTYAIFSSLPPELIVTDPSINYDEVIR